MDFIIDFFTKEDQGRLLVGYSVKVIDAPFKYISEFPLFFNSPQEFEEQKANIIEEIKSSITRDTKFTHTFTPKPMAKHITVSCGFNLPETPAGD